MDTQQQATTASWLNVLAGVWLIIAPFVLGYVYSTPRTNDIVLGVIVGVVALIRAFSPLRSLWASWVNVIAGVWLIISPFVLQYANTTPRWNDVILGIIVAVIALWNSGVIQTGQTRHAGV